MAKDSGTIRESLLDSYVFMDKVHQVLETGIKTEKNVILYGPGGHGKSEYTLEYLYEKGITPYVITMGTGMTIDRLFGGVNIKEYEISGKIEYLIENSFMNHEYVIFEEIMDAPDYILEQLKDILSSGQFRNGSQVFDIKTRFIVGCTNKTRDEYAKNASTKALMERFPLEFNVIWDNYTEAAYNTLLQKRFGAGKVDPIIPFLLQEYARNGITISPRIALDSYEIFEVCGPDSLVYIADFAKKPVLIRDALTKFQATIRFKQMGVEVTDLIDGMSGVTNITHESKEKFVADFAKLKTAEKELKGMTVNDDLIQAHAGLLGSVKDKLAYYADTYRTYDMQLKKASNKVDPSTFKAVPNSNGSTVGADFGSSSGDREAARTEHVDNGSTPAKKRRTAYKYE